MARLRKLLAVAKVEFVAREAEALITNAKFTGGRERLVIMTSSAKAAQELEEALIWTQHVNPGRIAGGVSQKERERIVDEFQNGGATNCIVATIGAAGQGINLFAADTMFFVDWDWSHAMNTQAEARTHRSGLESDKALYVNFIVNHWLDLAVAAACGRKKRYHETVELAAVRVAV
jgi:superfamily II DNA or RNA helicase